MSTMNTAAGEGGAAVQPARSSSNRWYATGRRKTAVARVYLYPGQGKVTINNRTIEDYFGREVTRMVTVEPFEVVGMEGKFDIRVTVTGGGLSGQAGAIRHGIARALLEYNSELRGTIKARGMLTRDARAKERKKYGQKGARARFQFSKR